MKHRMRGRVPQLREAVPDATALPSDPRQEPRGGFADTPTVNKAHQTCPYPGCRSTRSILVKTEPGGDGRMEFRRCKACLRNFRVWDSAGNGKS